MIYILTIVFGLVSCDNGVVKEPVAPANPVPSQKGSEAEGGYSLVWEDLFDADELDSNSWEVCTSALGGGNNELQYYIPENVSIEVDSISKRKCLVLKAKRENYNNKTCTSGKVWSLNKKIFKECKIEALIKMPKTYQGLWPAFWMMGYDYKKNKWPACGEIDILEAGHSRGMSTVEKSERFINGACHWGPSSDKKKSVAKNYQSRYSLQDDFHLYTLKWTPEKIECYLDLDVWPGQLPYYSLDIKESEDDTETSPSKFFHKPFFLIFNLAIGGNFPGIYDINSVTALNAENNYEAKMYIDYVRVYQKSE